MKVLVNDPYVTVEHGEIEQVELDELLRRSDFVLPLAVATEETENLIGAAQLRLMRRDAFLVNLSRGNLIDEAALAAALDEQRIAGAALDVGRAPDQMPSPHLAARTDVVATPHMAGLTTAGHRRPGARDRRPGRRDRAGPRAAGLRQCRACPPARASCHAEDLEQDRFGWNRLASYRKSRPKRKSCSTS